MNFSWLSPDRPCDRLVTCLQRHGVAGGGGRGTKAHLVLTDDLQLNTLVRDDVLHAQATLTHIPHGLCSTGPNLLWCGPSGPQSSEGIDGAQRKQTHNNSAFVPVCCTRRDTNPTPSLVRPRPGLHAASILLPLIMCKNKHKSHQIAEHLHHLTAVYHILVSLGVN